jgi:hypothetical protein
LVNGVAQTLSVHAINAVGPSVESAASNSVTPAAPSFTTWNPADKGTGVILSGGNLTASASTSTSANWYSTRSVVSKTSGKWYWEVTVGANTVCIGIGGTGLSLSNFAGTSADSWGYYGTGVIFNNSAGIGGSPASYAAGDVIGVALDRDVGTVKFYKNGVQQGPTVSGVTGAQFAVGSVREYGAPASSLTANFGASAFAFTPPAGYVGLA